MNETQNHAPLYVVIARTLRAWRNATSPDPNSEWAARWSDFLDRIEREYLPRDSGFNCGCTIDRDASTHERIVIHAPYHHMDADGYYCGWVNYRVIVRASLMFGFELSVHGRDRNGFKRYAYDLFGHLLYAMVPRHPA